MMFLLVLSVCSVLLSRQWGERRGFSHEVNAAGALMKFTYDTMWGVSALVLFFFLFDGL